MSHPLSHAAESNESHFHSTVLIRDRWRGLVPGRRQPSPCRRRRERRLRAGGPGKRSRSGEGRAHRWLPP